MLLELGSMGVEVSKAETKVPSPIAEVLQHYKNVFEWLNELPLSRHRDHAILMQPGASPVNVRPYRYPYFQKNEIEKLEREMLDASIIQHSSSPFFPIQSYL